MARAQTHRYETSRPRLDETEHALVLSRPKDALAIRGPETAFAFTALALSGTYQALALAPDSVSWWVSLGVTLHDLDDKPGASSA